MENKCIKREPPVKIQRVFAKETDKRHGKEDLSPKTVIYNGYFYAY